MAIAVFILLTLIAAGIIAYPLLPGRTPAALAPAVTAGEIDQAVRAVRRGRSVVGQGRGGLSCPACGYGYEPGDRFCVRCGEGLPEAAAASAGPGCPSCGADIRPGDLFCSTCGHKMAREEAL
jgi:predicted amidophosphoribosyltransferase